MQVILPDEQIHQIQLLLSNLIQKEIEQLAADYNMEVAQVQSLLSTEMLKHDITIKKAVELITSTATVK